MSHEEKWKNLADLLIELQKRGEKIPTDVMTDLRSAKTVIQILKADPAHKESQSRIDTYLRSVESYVIFTAEKLGKKTAEEWLKKIKGTKKTKTKTEKIIGSRFTSGAPRNKSWIRIKISDDTRPKDIEKVVKENKLSYKKQANGYILVHGNEKNIKSFVKQMAEQFRASRNE
ncbi:MAG: DUF2096 family protein [Candidatus Bathyarchaeota archaeon]|nr:DUF2096 family protein [Candidatus Bathyarchaeum sp.]